MKFKIIAVIEAVIQVPKGMVDAEGNKVEPKTVTKSYFENLIKLMGERESIQVVKSKIKDPIVVSEQLHNAFTEVTLEISSFADLIGFIIDFGPINLEILEPEDKAVMEIDELESVLGDLIAKISEYDRNLKLVTSELLKVKKIPDNTKENTA